MVIFKSPSLFAITIYISMFSSGCVNDDNLNTPPQVTTIAITDISQISATGGGNIVSEGNSIITEKGVCWDTIQTPTILNDKTIDGDGSGSFSSALLGLKPNTKYFVRAYASNESGIGYGNTVTLITNPFGTITDIDGNNYKTLIIGNSEWMFENLKVEHYRNGDALPLIQRDSDWIIQTNGAYCYYDSIESNGEEFGRLYNRYSISDSRNICPLGWHIPSVTEIAALKDAIGSESLIKIGFFKNNGGIRQPELGKSFIKQNSAYFWTSTSNSSIWNLCFNSFLFPDYNGLNTEGLYVRCIKD